MNRPHSFRLAVLLVGLALFVAERVCAVEIEGLPKAGEPHPALISKSREQTLPNGLRVIVVERPGLPLLYATMLIRSGAETDPPRLAGLARFTAGLLKRGTTTRNAQQIAEEIESLGARIETEAAWDSTNIKLSTLSSYAEPALAILADLVSHPAFAAEEIERQRRETHDDLVMALQQPGSVARFASTRLALGGSPYAHPEGGTPASVPRFTRQAIVALHARAYRPDNAIFVLAGNITAAEAYTLAAKSFGDWTPAPAPTKPAGSPHSRHPANPAPPAQASSDARAARTTARLAQTASPPRTSPPPARAVLVDMPNAGQAAVYLAAPGIPRTAPDWFAGKVTNALLGGGYSSRLNQEVRLKRGLSYGAASRLSTWRDTGLFIAGAQTKNESAKEVVEVMQTEIQRLSTEPVPPDYLKTRESVLTGAFGRDLETNEGYVQRIGELALYGLPLDSLEQYVEQVNQITPDDLQKFATQHLAAANISVLVAGQGKLVQKPLTTLLPKLTVIPLSKLDLDTPSLQPASKR